MKHYTFYRESDDFNDIINDITLKKKIRLKFRWYQHLTIGFNTIEDSIEGYLMLKFGDDLRSLTEKDYSPIPGVDYVPERKKKNR